MNENGTQNTGAAAPAVPGMTVKVYPAKEPGKLLAFASVNLGGVFAINNVRIYNSEKGPFVSMPSSKGKDGQYHDICFPREFQQKEFKASILFCLYQQSLDFL